MRLKANVITVHRVQYRAETATATDGNTAESCVYVDRSSAYSEQRWSILFTAGECLQTRRILIHIHG